MKKQEKPLSKLSNQQDVRARNIYYGIGQVFTMTIEENIYNYELDLQPEREIQIWEIMNLCFLEFIAKHNITDSITKKEIASILIYFSIGQLYPTSLLEDDVNELFKLWQKYFYEY